MLDIILETLIDSVKLLPFLFLSYLLIEYIEHKSSKKIEKTLSKSGKYGPAVGALLGCFPQCGFSVTASNLFSGRVITLGTLIAVFLSTSDEAIPVLLSHPDNWGEILKLLLFKLVIGMIAGFVIDFIYRRKHTVQLTEHETHEHIHDMCKHCDCEHGILRSTLKHTMNTFLFIMIVTFILNVIITLIGEENLSKVLMSNSIFQPLIASFIGLIPNCASSVLLTELYLAGSISFGSIIAGLSTGGGLGLVILFKTNKNLKENLKILGLLYGIGTVAGILIEIVGMMI
ncbi:MAG: putative manganese transporter [Clostridia bacterium]|nr:putative manganese transporter [Clostridia bacterium]